MPDFALLRDNLEFRFYEWLRNYESLIGSDLIEAIGKAFY